MFSIKQNIFIRSARGELSGTISSHRPKLHKKDGNLVVSVAVFLN